MCYAKTVPFGTLSTFIIQIVINVSFLPYTYMLQRYMLWKDGTMW